MTRPDRALEAEVIGRAQGRCKYCHFPEAAAELPFHSDHIIAEKHGGKTAVGRTTVAVLAINDADSIAVREALRDEGIFAS